MVKALIMSGYGINCEEESKHAFELAGSEAKIVHINDLISKKENLKDYHIIMFPGGFSYGDDTFSGNAFANRVKNNLWEELKEFIDDKKLIIGVCNGFQVMTNLGLFALDDTEYGRRVNALISNDSNRYECRWVNIVKDEDTECVFTKGIERSFLPIAHGEGKFYCDKATLEKLGKGNQIVFRYSNEDGSSAQGEFPSNPNGSIQDIAGICDRTGRIMGMMPHPERAIYSINRPDFHMMKDDKRREGKRIAKINEPNLKIFKNAVEYVEENFE